MYTYLGNKGKKPFDTVQILYGFICDFKAPPRLKDNGVYKYMPKVLSFNSTGFRASCPNDHYIYIYARWEKLSLSKNHAKKPLT